MSSFVLIDARFTEAVLLLAVFCAVSASEDIIARRCDDIDPPEFGNVTYQLGDSGEQKAVFDCTFGYILEGHSTLSCLGDHWSDKAPICKLGIFDGIGNGSTCHLDSSTGCKYVNDVRNPIMWQIEEWDEEDDGTTRVITEEAPAALLRCEPQYCPNQSSLVRRRRSPKKKEIIVQPLKQQSSRRGATKVTSTQAVLNIPASRRRSVPGSVVIVETFFELGPFDTSSSNNYLKFTVTGSANALAQELYVVAHCLPDPPGHLDHLSSSDYEMVRMPLSGRSQTKCLQLKGRVHRCNVFTIRFSVFVRYDKTQKVRVSIRPKNTYSTLASAQCRGSALLNP